MYPSYNNSCKCTNPINNVPKISSSYRNGCATESSPKVIPRNKHNAASTQVFQQNNWDSNKSASTLLPTSYLRRLYKLDSIKNNDEMSIPNSNNTEDYNHIQNGYKNQLNFQTPKTKKFDGVYLSVNRRTQPGISAAIRLLSQNLKPKTSPNNEVNDDSNGNSVTCEIVTSNINTNENNHNKITTNDKNDKLSITSPQSGGVEYFSWKNKRHSYTPTLLSNYNYGNNIGNSYINTSTSVQTINNEDTNKLANSAPWKMTKADSFTLMKPSLHNNGNDEIYLTNSNSGFTTNFNDNKDNKYSSLCTRTNNYDTLFKRSSSTSPYRPLANYRPSWSLSSNHKILSNETLYNSVDNHNEYVTPKQKYLDSKISNNNISNKHRPSDNETTTGTQTPMTTVISQNLQGSLTTLSSLGGNGNNNATRYLNKNDHFPPRPIIAKPSFHSKHNTNEVNMERNDEHHKYGRTYYIARRPQIAQSNHQKYLPHALNHDRNLSFNNIYDANTLINNTDTADHDFNFTNKTISKKINRMSDFLKPNSYLSNSTLASYERNSSSLNSLPNEIGSLPSLIQSEYYNDDHRINSNHSDKVVANRSIFDNYSPIYYPNNQTLYTARRNFPDDRSHPSLQTKYSYHQDNPEAFRSFSVSPEIGRRISEDSVMLPSRSYNEDINMIGSNSNLRLCSSAPSPLKRKPYQVSFNLDRNTYIEYPYSESSTSLVQCKRVPGYISSSGATPGETNVNFKTSPKYPFSWSNENGVTTIGKAVNGYDNEYSKQINYPPSLYTSWPIRPKYNRYSSPPPQQTLNHDGDNINFNCSTTDQTAIIDPSTLNSYTAAKPEIRFIDTTLSSPGNFNLNSINNINTNKPPVFGRSLNGLKLLLSKSTHRFDANNSNANLNGGKSLFKQIEHDSINPRHNSAIDILNQTSSFSS